LISQPLQSQSSITRVMNLLGAFAATVFAVAIPLLYYLVSINETHYSLTMEVTSLSKSIEKIIQSRPDMWEYEVVRLQEIVSQPSLIGKRSEKEIRTAAGRLVAKTDYTVSQPVIEASATFFDSGRPAGSIKAILSIRTQIAFTALLGVFSSLLGFLFYFIFRTYPIKKLDSTLADLQRAQEEQRTSRETAERLAEETAVIAELGRLIGSTLDIHEVYERFAAEARKLIPFDRIAVNLCNISDNIIITTYVTGMEIPHRLEGNTSPCAGTLTGLVTGERKSLLIQPEDTPEGIAEIVRRIPELSSTFQAGLRSLLSTPLISRDEAIGTLHLQSKKTKAYTERDLRLAERIGVQISGAIANAQFHTDLKRAEQSLRESEGRFRALVEQAAVGVAEIDTVTGRFLTVNRRLCEMVGRTEGEMLTLTYRQITHQEDQRLQEEEAALLLAGKIGYYSLEKRYLRKDGSAIWVDVTISPLWKEGETPGRYITVVQDITERLRMEAEIREMSLRDLLTDLYNRRGFITLAEQQLKAANRAKRPLKLTFIDCDGLKWINDTLGHQEGDTALIDTAQILRQTFRESDIIARLGGDEFAVLSIDAKDMGHEDFSRRLQQNIDRFNSKKSRLFKLSMSWGTAMYYPESPMSLDQLISAADELMYAQKKTKANGRM
jgi:diguanylate cyclase (GGDEF)-like protein/PAS domain S-box-containing protein